MIVGEMEGYLPHFLVGKGADILTMLCSYGLECEYRMRWKALEYDIYSYLSKRRFGVVRLKSDNGG